MAHVKIPEVLPGGLEDMRKSSGWQSLPGVTVGQQRKAGGEESGRRTGGSAAFLLDGSKAAMQESTPTASQARREPETLFHLRGDHKRFPPKKTSCSNTNGWSTFTLRTKHTSPFLLVNKIWNRGPHDSYFHQVLLGARDTDFTHLLPVRSLCHTGRRKLGRFMRVTTCHHNNKVKSTSNTPLKIFLTYRMRK